MKNLLIFISPEKQFTGYYPNLAKIQIDNCKHFGWEKDLILVTNFEFEYGGIKSIVVDPNSFCEKRPRSTKTNTISFLIENKIIEGGKTYWVHDWDAYQLNPFNEVDMNGCDIALTDYGYKPRLSLGSYFFKKEAKDILEYIRNGVFQWGVEDESVLKSMGKTNALNVNDRLKKINITYNFAIRQIGEMYKMAEQPIKVLHFRPEPYRLGQFMYGRNDLKRPLMSDRLIELFKQHGIQ